MWTIDIGIMLICQIIFHLDNFFTLILLHFIHIHSAPIEETPYVAVFSPRGGVAREMPDLINVSTNFASPGARSGSSLCEDDNGDVWLYGGFAAPFSELRMSKRVEEEDL
jgi:hypothetical protein